MLYTVISSDQEKDILKGIKKIDPKAFINVLQTKEVAGNFFIKQND